MKKSFVIICAINAITLAVIIKKMIARSNELELNTLFNKIKELMIMEDIHYPNIKDIEYKHYYKIKKITNCAINRKIIDLTDKIKYLSVYSKDIYTPELRFFQCIKFMNSFHDNFVVDDKVKPNTKVAFNDTKWYEISTDVKHLIVLDNDNINLNNLHSGIEELCVFYPKSVMTNLPSTLKKLYLYNIEDTLNVKNFKIPHDCQLYIENYLIDKNKLC
jgi:hypothetical protein